MLRALSLSRLCDTWPLFSKVGMGYHVMSHPNSPMGEDELRQIRTYQDSDSRVEFMSVFPVSTTNSESKHENDNT